MDRKLTPAVECVSNLQLMTGATGAPAPESAVSQIQIPGINDGRKVIGKMKPMKTVDGYHEVIATLKSRGKTHGYSDGIADEVQVALVQIALERNGLTIKQVPSDVDDNHYMMSAQVTDQVTIGDKVFDGFYDERLMSLLGVAKPLELVDRNVPDVLTLMSEALGYDTDAIEYLEQGSSGAPVVATQWGCSNDHLSVIGCTPVYVTFHDIDLDPMSVSDFGNFLYALHHYGHEVALATLRFIYENAR